MAVMITFRRSGAGVVPNGGDYLKGRGGVLEAFRGSGAGVVPNGGDYLKGHGGVLEEKDAVNGQSPQRR